jgi:hypothetical protein
MRGLAEIVSINSLAAAQEIAAAARKAEARRASKVSIKRRQGAAIVMAIGEKEVLFSYETPVAAFVPGKGYLRTNVNYSKTTSLCLGLVELFED